MKFNRLDAPVVAIDLDGTLVDYHSHFLKFAEQWYGREMPDPSTINPGLPLHKFMKTSKATYRRCKLAYRQGGLKRSMPCYEGATELCKAVRKSGALLYIATTRPYLRLDQIDPDTRECLRRNRIQYDALVWGESKYRDITRIVGADRVAAVLDDLPEQVAIADSLGLPTILRDQPYNKHMFKAERVKRLDTAQLIIVDWIEQWKEKHGA